MQSAPARASGPSQGVWSGPPRPPATWLHHCSSTGHSGSGLGQAPLAPRALQESGSKDPNSQLPLRLASCHEAALTWSLLSHVSPGWQGTRFFPVTVTACRANTHPGPRHSRLRVPWILCPVTQGHLCSAPGRSFTCSTVWPLLLGLMPWCGEVGRAREAGPGAQSGRDQGRGCFLTSMRLSSDWPCRPELTQMSRTAPPNAPEQVDPGPEPTTLGQGCGPTVALLPVRPGPPPALPHAEPLQPHQ